MLFLNKTEKFLKICFYTVFALFPLTVALFLGGKHFLFGAYEEVTGTDTLYNWPIFCVLLVTACVLLVFIIYRKNWDKKLFHTLSHKKLALVILALALIIRVALFVVFESVLIPFSDGNHVWQVAHTNNEVYLNLKSTQNGWNNFMGIVVFLVRNLNIQYPLFILVQFLADGFIAFAVFKLAYEIFKSEDIAFWAGLFYAVNPIALARMFYFSPECYSLLCLTFAAYTFVRMLNTADNKAMYKHAAITGVLLGVGNSLKSISIIFIVAVLIIVILRTMAGKINKTQLVSWLLAFIIVAVPAFGINRVALKVTTAVTGAEARDLLMFHQLNVGLNPYGYGNTGETNAWYYSGLIQAGTEPSEARDMLIEKLKTDWQESEKKVIPWLGDKVRYAWSESTAEFTLLMQNSIGKEHNTVQHYAYIAILNFATSGMQVFYILMLLLSLAGTVFIMFRHINNDGAMLAPLYIFGFSLLMLIIECQPRYKANIISFLAVIAAAGLYESVKAVAVKKEKTEKTVQTAEN